MKYFWILGIMFTFIACKDKKTAIEEDTFKKTELLQQISDNYILPEYAKLQSEVTTLATTASSFEAVPSITSFDSFSGI